MTQMRLELEPRAASRPPTDDNELARALVWGQQWRAHKERTGFYSTEMAREFPVPNCNKRNRTRRRKEIE